MSDYQGYRRDRLEAIYKLRSWAWESFDRRREFEGKINIGVWAGLSALIGLLYGKDVLVTKMAMWCAFGLTAIFYALYCFYIFGLESVQRIDRTQMDDCDKILEEEFGLLSPELRKRRAAYAARPGALRSYSHVFELALTLLLCACLIGIVFLKFHNSAATPDARPFAVTRACCASPMDSGVMPMDLSRAAGASHLPFPDGEMLKVIRPESWMELKDGAATESPQSE